MKDICALFALPVCFDNLFAIGRRDNNADIPIDLFTQRWARSFAEGIGRVFDKCFCVVFDACFVLGD